MATLPILDPRISTYQQQRLLADLRYEATQARHPAILATLDAADAFIHTALEVERRFADWQTRQPSGTDAQQLQRQIHTRIATLHATLYAVSIRGEHLGLHNEAGSLLWMLFPQGLGAHLQAPHATQVHLTDSVVLFLRSPLRAAFITRLGIRTMIDEIGTLNAVLKRTLDDVHAPTLADVDEAADAAFDALTVTLHTIGAYLHLADEADAPKLAAMLDPVASMNRRIQKQHGPHQPARFDGSAPMWLACETLAMPAEDDLYTTG